MSYNRRWKVFIAPSCHVDVGYNFLQRQALDNHEKNISKAIEACKENPKFRWNLESAWIAQKYLQDNPTHREAFLNLAKNGQIGIQSAYLNMLTGIMSHEAMNRLCYFAGLLKREHKIPMQSGMLTDVPSAIWTLPTALALSGVKYFVHGVNPIFGRGPFYPRTDINSPFWWQGPDGSKVLTWLASGYGQANELLGLEEGCKHLEHTLPDFLSRYENSSYPFDAVLVYGAHYENKVMDPSFSEVIEEWNSKHEYPKLLLSTPDEFFEYIEQNFKDKLPTYVGDEGCWWEDGVASSAHETLLIRGVHEKIITAEKVWSLLSLIEPSTKYPFRRISDVWEKIFLYDEHTWGANKSITEPELEFVQEQWKMKSSFARDAVKEADSLVNKGFSILTSGINTDNKPTLLVFNQLSWTRTDIAVVKMHRMDRKFAIVDTGTKQSVPYQWIGQEELCFVAKDLPSMGYKKYEVHHDREPADSGTSVRFFSHGMGNKFYRIEFDPKTGAISRLYDKELECEFADNQSEYGLNQYIYTKGGSASLAVECDEALVKLKEMGPEISEELRNMISLPKFVDKLPLPQIEFFSPTLSEIQPGNNGPVFGEIRVRAACEKTPKILQRIVLYNSLKRIDIINEFDKEETYEKEGVYFAFPFRLKKPEIKIEISNGVLRPEKDQMVGACRDWYCTQHHVTLSDEKHTVVWATPDAPLISIQDINIGKWLEKLEIENGSLFSYVMNNYWYTNYKASQKGSKMRYSITTQEGTIENFEALHFGWCYANPPLAALLAPNLDGRPVRGGSGVDQSFFGVSEPNLVITAIKSSEDEKGWIVRLFETEGKEGEAVLQLPAKFKNAYLCNLIEEETMPLPIEGSKVKVPFSGQSIMTVKLVNPD